jgi:hypothetical protein
MADNKSLKSRVLTVVALLSGSCAAGLFWRNYHPVSLPNVTDAQARQNGYFSAKDQQEEQSERATYLHDMYKLHTFTALDMDFAQRTLGHGSRTARVLLLTNLAFLGGEANHREILSFWGAQPIPQDLHNRWAHMLSAWENDQHDPATFSMLTHCLNPDVAKIAKEVKLAPG